MRYINQIIEGLANSPMICKQLIAQIPDKCLRKRRKVGKWNIHEHICHLADAETMILQRFTMMIQQEPSIFSPYLPDEQMGTQHFDLKQTSNQLDAYKMSRAKVLRLIRGFTNDDWFRPFQHEEYIEYSPYILLRHTLMHDFFHMYRIEELWLTKDEYLH